MSQLRKNDIFWKFQWSLMNFNKNFSGLLKSPLMQKRPRLRNLRINDRKFFLQKVLSSQNLRIHYFSSKVFWSICFTGPNYEYKSLLLDQDRYYLKKNIYTIKILKSRKICEKFSFCYSHHIVTRTSRALVHHHTIPVPVILNFQWIIMIHPKIFIFLEWK